MKIFFNFNNTDFSFDVDVNLIDICKTTEIEIWG